MAKETLIKNYNLNCFYDSEIRKLLGRQCRKKRSLLQNCC